jgi:hypothetical protein
MVRHTAVVVTLALVAGSGALLFCQWACASDDAAARLAPIACHRTQGDAPVMQASTHDCIATTATPETTAAKSAERTKSRVSMAAARTITLSAMLPIAPSHRPAPPGTSHSARPLSVIVLRV